MIEWQKKKKKLKSRYIFAAQSEKRVRAIDESSSRHQSSHPHRGRAYFYLQY